ncbi:MAG: ExbD/TolR family protein [Phycisphaerales bacterium]
MSFGRRHQSGKRLLVEITPMIDVVFLLIVFFMTAARFARETRAPMELPREAGHSDVDEARGLVINLMDDGRTVVGEMTVDLVALERRVQAHLADPDSGAAVTVRADRRASTSDLNALVRELESMGVIGVRVGTEAP